MNSLIKLCMPFVLMIMARIEFCQAQTDTILSPYKNTIRYNLTGPLIFSNKYIVFGYERMTGRNQSVSLNAGRFALPGFESSGSVLINTSSNEKGLHLSTDYRLYLTRLNKYDGPRGVYIGAYYSYNAMDRENDWSFNKSEGMIEVSTKTTVQIHSAGLQLGYQFIFWKRLAVDFVTVGPGFAHYNLKTGLSANLNATDHGKIVTAIADNLLQKLPGLNKTFNSTEYVEKNGINKWSIVYRYILHVGFRF